MPPTVKSPICSPRFLNSSASCSVGTIAEATARPHHNTRAVKHPTRTAQLRPAGAAGSKGHSRLFRPAVPVALGVALARRGGRGAMQPHCNACRRNSRGPPPRSNATCNRQQHRHIIALFFLFYSRCLFVCPITDTKNKCTPSQKGRNKEKRRHDPTVPQRANTLLHPPPLPHRRPQSHRRVSTTMCTAPSCSERWARRGHASPRFTFLPLKCCVPAQSSKQNQSAHKPNHPPHSLKHIIRMEWHPSTQQQ
ncbi:hypothetical protein ECC02_012308 [Trypanosoma cruzi]|uniref:Uncharacterized protein n=1 Tax=Trypanosoma cruzi TaxID=5693 RepID=A0A7J6XLD3_TRYCR|nr:hypothetical protein ECC02_012308 [Trypanosoma cruzi]